MIEVRYSDDDCILEAKGHAGAAKNEYGHDLVCCAVSTLMDTYEFASCMEGCIMLVEADKGYKRLEPDPKCRYQPAVKHYLTCKRGMEMLASERPEHVRLVRIK